MPDGQLSIHMPGRSGSNRPFDYKEAERFAEEQLRRFLDREYPSKAAERFARVTAAELAEPPEKMKWLIKQVWPEGGYGVYGGAKKTLKTYMVLALVLAIASGRPFLGYFEVTGARPVVMYLSEGGKENTKRRLQAIADFMGISNADLAALPITMVFDAAPIGSDLLTASVQRDLDELKPALVVMDALYAFHAPDVEAQNLYDRGAMLSEVQRLVVTPDRALILVDHFSKQREKVLDLNAISQSGVGEWSSAWGLALHREDPRVADGQFRLSVQLGGRDGYGSDWAIDWDLGPLGSDGIHSGPISVAVRPLAGETVNSVDAAIFARLRDEPFAYTETELVDAVGGNKANTRSAVKRILAGPQVQSQSVKRTGKDDKKHPAIVYGVPVLRLHVPAPPTRASVDPEASEVPNESGESTDARVGGVGRRPTPPGAG